MTVDFLEKLLSVPRVRLGNFPTPITKIFINSNCWFWLKDDGVGSAFYSGNKLRKLEYIFSEAMSCGKHKIVTFGDDDSHTVQAASILGSRLGFQVEIIVFPYKSKSADKFNFEQVGDVHVCYAKNFIEALIRVLLKRMLFGYYIIPLGCTSPISTLGYVRAVVELYEQFFKEGSGLPRRIFVALGTGGTVAGLLIGIALLDLPVRVVAVRTVGERICNKRKLKRLIGSTLDLLEIFHVSSDEVLQRLERIENGYLGKGYKDRPIFSVSAVEAMKEKGLTLEPVFTGKAMAALLDNISGIAPEGTLFWNTHNRGSNLLTS